MFKLFRLPSKWHSPATYLTFKGTRIPCVYKHIRTNIGICIYVCYYRHVKARMFKYINTVKYAGCDSYILSRNNSATRILNWQLSETADAKSNEISLSTHVEAKKEWENYERSLWLHSNERYKRWINTLYSLLVMKGGNKSHTTIPVIPVWRSRWWWQPMSRRLVFIKERFRKQFIVRCLPATGCRLCSDELSELYELSYIHIFM